MNTCLCCGKPLDRHSDAGWHKHCIKKFFNTPSLPKIAMDDESLKKLTLETIKEGFTVPGVQKKLSLHLLSEGKTAKLTLVDYPTGYILKPQVDAYPQLPESEFLTMHMAEMCGIKTVPNALIQCENNVAYITKRIDRVTTKTGTRKLAMEDFCQLDMKPVYDKYRGSYERCAKIIERYSTHTGLDLSEFFIRIVFSFLVGNSDMHLKNFSLLEDENNTGSYNLAPAYDFLPVNMILPEDTEECALTLNGKKRNIRKSDFLILANHCDLSSLQATRLIQRQLSLKESWFRMIDDSLLSQTQKDAFKALMEERMQILA